MVLAQLAMAQAPLAAEISVRSGVTGGTVLRPFSQVKLSEDWTVQGWTSTLKTEARAVLREDSLDDASMGADWHSEKLLQAALLFEFDAHYGFDRDRDTDIDHSHDFSTDLGFTSTFDHAVLKTDLGLFARHHQDTQRAGLPALDRSTEDFWEADLAVRLTQRSSASWKPFIETALVRREYMINTGRAFLGPDLIAGITIESSTLTGDLGLLFAARKAVEEPTATVLGPYVDLKFVPASGFEATLDLSSGLDQDTTGDSRPFRFYEANLVLAHAATDALTLSAVLESSWEGRSTGAETEITPLLKLEWTGHTGLGVFASAGFTYTKTEGLPADYAPSLEAGLKLDLD